MESNFFEWRSSQLRLLTSKAHCPDYFYKKSVLVEVTKLWQLTCRALARPSLPELSPPSLDEDMDPVLLVLLNIWGKKNKPV